MTTAKVFAQGPYGAFELKRCYQRNMITGTIISAGLPLLLLGILAPAGYMAVTDSAGVGIGSEGKIVVTIPSPTPIQTPSQPRDVKIKTDIPEFGAIPRPVEDNLAVDNTVVMTRIGKEKIVLAGLDQGTAQGLAAGVYAPGEMIGEIIPEPTEFIPVTKEPILVHAPVPVYPEMARKARMQGEVWMQIYVDKEGHVRKVRVTKSSNTSAGFEEAAKAAAWDRKYAPAMQNDQPVGVWVTYKVRFRLRE
jgi:TonB family protein